MINKHIFIFCIILITLLETVIALEMIYLGYYIPALVSVMLMILYVICMITICRKYLK